MIDLLDAIEAQLRDCGAFVDVRQSNEGAPLTQVGRGDKTPAVIIYRGDIKYGDQGMDQEPVLTADHQFIVQLISEKDQLQALERATATALAGWQPAPEYWPCRPVESKAHTEVGHGRHGPLASRFLIFAIEDLFSV